MTSLNAIDMVKNFKNAEIRDLLEKRKQYEHLNKIFIY